MTLLKFSLSVIYYYNYSCSLFLSMIKAFPRLNTLIKRKLPIELICFNIQYDIPYIDYDNLLDDSELSVQKVMAFYQRRYKNKYKLVSFKYSSIRKVFTFCQIYKNRSKSKY